MNISAETYIDRLGALHVEIERALEDLSQEDLDWAPGEGMNSIAVLVAHIVGVERYYVGELAGDRLAHRDRPAEFATQGVDADGLKALLADSLAFCREVALGLTADQLATEKLFPSLNQQVSGAWTLLQGLAHVAVHVGHIHITRDLIRKR